MNQESKAINVHLEKRENKDYLVFGFEEVAEVCLNDDESQNNLKSIFVNFRISHIPQFFNAQPVWSVMMIILIVCHAIPSSWADYCRRKFIRSPWVVKLLLFLIVVQFVIIYMSAEIAPFIYFQF